jgi:hypothetical protein
VLALFLWVLASIISTTSVDVLKRRIAISAWIALPSLPAAIAWFFPSLYGPVTPDIFLALFLWTDVYTALIVGVGDRRALSIRPGSLSVLSLPLATLVFTGVSFGAIKLFIEYGTFPDTLTCGNPPYLPLTGCGYFQYEGFYVAAVTLLLLIVCGATLPTNSNLIRGYVWLNARFRLLFPFGRRPDFKPKVQAPLEEWEPLSSRRSNTN